MLTGDCSSVQWSKRWPTVEARGRSSLGPLPDEEEMASVFGEALERHLERAETVSVIVDSPGTSPLVFAESEAFGFVVAVPLLARDETPHRLLHSRSVSDALESVTSVARYLDAMAPAGGANYLFWASLSMTISMAMPLGSLVRPLVAGEVLAQSGLDRDVSASAQPALDGSLVSKAPCWRVGEEASSSAPSSKRARVVITVEEIIESQQYDSALGAEDAALLYGTVSVWSDVVGVAPEVSLKAHVSGKRNGDWEGLLQSVSADPYNLSFAMTQSGKDRIAHVSLVPSVKIEHVVMRFDSRPPQSMPFRAFYQMKPVSEREAKLLIQIKLHERVENSFEYCRVVLPFESVAPIESFESSPTEGTVKRTPDSQTLVWDLGTTIAGRKLECALPMTVTFSEDIRLHSRAATSPSAYAEIVFKMLDAGISGVRIDPDQVSIYPSTSAQVTVNYALLSGTYRVWNSLGESVRQIQPPIIE